MSSCRCLPGTLAHFSLCQLTGIVAADASAATRGERTERQPSMLKGVGLRFASALVRRWCQSGCHISVPSPTSSLSYAKHCKKFDLLHNEQELERISIDNGADPAHGIRGDQYHRHTEALRPRLLDSAVFEVWALVEAMLLQPRHQACVHKLGASISLVRAALPPSLGPIPDRVARCRIIGGGALS